MRLPVNVENRVDDIRAGIRLGLPRLGASKMGAMRAHCWAVTSVGYLQTVSIQGYRTLARRGYPCFP